MSLSNVGYLENDDMKDDGTLTIKPCPKNAVVLVYGDFCGHCKNFKPIFQAVANEKSDVSFYAIDLGGTRPSQKLLSSKLNKCLTNYRGVPHIVFYKNCKRVEEYGGNRSKDDFKSWIQKHKEK